MTTTKLPIVEIVWDDANVRGGWRTRGAYRKQELASCRTVGYLLKKTGVLLTVVQSQHEENVSDSVTIPWSCVKSITRLK